MSQEVSKWLVNALYPQYTPFISRWTNPLILTIDPNFQRDIQVVGWNIHKKGVEIHCQLYVESYPRRHLNKYYSSWLFNQAPLTYPPKKNKGLIRPY